MKKFLTLLLITALSSQITHPFTNKSFMTYRSQGQNLAREVSGWQALRTDIFNGAATGNASLTVEYTQSFNADAINRYFFGCECLTFSGSRVPYRGKNDIMADYFGLPTDFQSSVCFKPRMRNVIADLDFYWNLDCLIKGFNLHLNIPVASTKWELNPCETVIDPGTLAYPAGYMSRNRINYDDLKKNALNVLSGGQPIGDVISPLQYGRINNCSQHTTKIADILVALGYTFVRDRRWLVGANVQVIVPTGTRSHACTLFEPQVGNGHHWALGGGLTARYDIIDNQERDLRISACLDASIQHLFKTTEKRSYDLIKNGPGSRYMLLEDMIGTLSIAQNFSAVPLDPPFLENQYITRLLYAIDATTFYSTIKINVQADIVAKLTADYRNWNFDLGYNFWGRSHETLVSRQCLNHKYYGIKGDAQVYGFVPISLTFFLPVPINATQSQATLHAGQGAGNTTNNFINNNADNATLIWNVGAPMAQTTIDSLTGTGITGSMPEQTHGSNQAIILSDSDINDCSGLSPRALSNKIFGSAGYTWRDCNHVKPYVALGAEGEFAGNDDCVKTAISQWGVWIKGGFNY
jgi:hypothetical protein